MEKPKSSKKVQGQNDTASRARDTDEAPALPRKAALAALDRATTAIRKLQRDVARNFWAIGRRLLQIAELKLHRARGYTSLEQYAAEQLNLSRAQVFQYMRVASAFSARIAETFGPEKLDRALQYIAATPENEKPEDIPTLSIQVPSEDGRGVIAKPFAEVTVEELRRAAQAMRQARDGKQPKGKKKHNKVDADVPAEVVKIVAKANKALDAAVGKRAAHQADIAVHAQDDGNLTVEVHGVPFERAAAAFKALAAAMK